MAIYTVSNLVGVTADYTTIQGAIDVMTDTDTAIVLGGTYSENVLISTALNYFDLNFCGGAKMRGTSGDGIRIGGLSGSAQEMYFRGLDISGYDNQIRHRDTFVGKSVFFENCKFEGNIKTEYFMFVCDFTDCLFNNVDFTPLLTTGAYVGSMGKCTNVTFNTCTNIIFLASRSSQDSSLQNVILKDSSFSIFADGTNGGAGGWATSGYGIFKSKNVIVDNCTFKTVPITTTTVVQHNSLSFVSISDTVGMQSKMDADAATLGQTSTTLTGASEVFNFQSVALDSFNYPTSKSESEILNRHIGANRYAISQTVPTANVDYTDVAGVYESNKVTPTPLVYELEVPRAGFARTTTLHFTRSGSTEQLGTNGEIEILIETSTDGTNFTTLGTFLSGIDSSTLDFDFLNAPAKAIRASIQPVGAAFGEIQIEGITVDFKTLEDRLSQVDARTFYSAGNIPSAVTALFNRSINNPVPDFTQLNDAKQLMTSSTGGLESPVDNAVMNSTFEGDSVFTNLTYAYWIYIPTDFVPSRFHYTQGNWNGVTLPNAYGIGLGLRYLGTDLCWRVLASNGNYSTFNYDLLPSATFVTKYSGRFIHLAFTFKDGEIKLYMDGENVLTYVNVTSDIKFPADGVFSVHGTNNQLSRGFDSGFKTEAHYLSLGRAYSDDEIRELRNADQLNNEHLR